MPRWARSSGVAMPFSNSRAGSSRRHRRRGAAPAAARKGRNILKFPGKNEGLVVLGDRPLVAETPESLLDDDTTPIEKFYIRNNGQIPDEAKDADSLEDRHRRRGQQQDRDHARRVEEEIQGGDVSHGAGMRRQRPRRRSRRRRAATSGPMAAPAAPNGPAVRLPTCSRTAGLKSSAKYTAHYAADLHLSGNPNTPPISRGVRLEKAMDPHTLIVWGDERPAAAEHPRRAGASRRSGLGRLGVAEMADAHHDPRQGA